MPVEAETLVRWYQSLSSAGKEFVDRNSDIVNMAIDYAIETEDHESEDWWSTEGLTDRDFDNDFLVFLENSASMDEPGCHIWFELDGEVRVSECFMSASVAAAIWKRWSFRQGTPNQSGQVATLLGFISTEKAKALQEKGEALAYPQPKDVEQEGE